MHTRWIDHAATGFFDEHILRYLQEDKELKPFYNLPPSPGSFAEAMRLKSGEAINRELLVEVLLQQNTGAHANSIQNIHRLSETTTFTVCSGHQLCLFTGPLYFLYKLVTAINLAEELKKKYPGNDFVPIYWMASEDHDFEEINHVHLYGKKISWDKTSATGNAQLAVGKIATGSLETVVQELEVLLGESAHASELKKIFRDAYCTDRNLSEATRSLVNELLGAYGLVILDADDERLKKEFSAVLHDDIFNNTNYGLVSSTIQKLAEQHIKAQVNPRKINVFYMTGELRQRIEETSDQAYSVLNTGLVFSKEELEKELEMHPGRFSPNVVLRPLYQEKILPNLAYVGGAGELSYWLEYKSMFEHHKVVFPLLWLRNSVLYIDTAGSERLKKLGIPVTDLFGDTELLIRQYIINNASADTSMDKEAEELKEFYGRLAVKAGGVDATLKPAADAELQKATNGLKTLEQKLLRAEKQKQETSVAQLRKLREKFFPGGALQERYENFIPYYSKKGKGFIQELKAHIDPFDRRFLVLEE